MILIGIIGLKGAGKDTVADFLIRHHQFQKRSFADPVKETCQTLFMLEREQLHDTERKEETDPRWGVSPRQMMQTLGTDMVRSHLGEDFWLRHMDIYTKQHQPQRLVVPDVRFANEADWIKRNHGVLVRVHDDRTHSEDPHPSETEQLSIKDDYCIFNPKSGITAFHQHLEGVIPTILDM